MLWGALLCAAALLRPMLTRELRPILLQEASEALSRMYEICG